VVQICAVFRAKHAPETEFVHESIILRQIDAHKPAIKRLSYQLDNRWHHIGGDRKPPMWCVFCK